MQRIDVAAARLVPAFGIAGDDADMAVAQARGLGVAHGLFGRGIVVIDVGDGLGHGMFLVSVRTSC
jgi:hypothetical protein